MAAEASGGNGQTDIAHAKAVVADYYRALDEVLASDRSAGDPTSRLEATIGKFTTAGYHWRGMYPFYEQHGVSSVVDTFWGPTVRAFGPLQRRPDVFMAGANDVDGGQTTWVCQMGHLLGLFDEPWLDIPPTRKMTFLRFAEFHRVEGDLIVETALFTDVISVMAQAGHNPLPPSTGSSHIQPGPATHDGLLFEPQDPAEGATTMALVNRMVADLTEANEIAAASGDDRMDPSVLAKTWHQDMIWSGPQGIGATYTIDRYQQQHQHPFRFNLADKVFNGHIARFAEGNFAGFFGWSNLTNRPTGGFLGLPGSGPADMRVVDIYRRSGDKLAENWVFIDLGHWLNMQGLDVLGRMRQLLGKEEF